MPRGRRKKIEVEEEVLVEAPELEEAEPVVVEEVPKKVAKVKAPTKKLTRKPVEMPAELMSDENPAFKAVLLNGPQQYMYMGMQFRRGIPRAVAAHYYSAFKSNGWFRIVPN